MDNDKLIIIQKGKKGYFVYLEENDSIYGQGQNIDEAVGNLIRNHTKEMGFKLKINY